MPGAPFFIFSRRCSLLDFVESLYDSGGRVPAAGLPRGTDLEPPE